MNYRKLLCFLLIPSIIASCFLSKETRQPGYDPTLISQILPTNTKDTVIQPIIQNCLTTLSSLPTSLYGNLLIRRNEEISKSILLNLKNNIEVEMPQNAILYPSPDREKIAYVLRDQSEMLKSIVVTESENSAQHTFEWQESWSYFQGWLGNNHLLINDKGTKTFPPYDLVVLDIRTGDAVNFDWNYPEINTVNFTQWNLSGVVYNTNLSYVIYQTDDMKTILWDIREQFKLIEIDYTSTRVPEPQWLRNDEEYVVMGTLNGNKNNIDEFIKVDTDGKIDQLSNFGDNNALFSIDNFKISPNEKLITFWATLDGLTYKLYILNLDTFKTYDLCFIDTSNNLPIPPIWSPNGEYLLLQTFEGKNNTVTYIVNIIDNWVFRFMNNIRVDGWIVN